MYIDASMFCIVNFIRANTGEDKAREALEQQARVKGKKGFRPEYNPLMGMGGGSGYRLVPEGSATLLTLFASFEFIFHVTSQLITDAT